MKHSSTNEQINLITWMPEGHTWGSVSSLEYHSPKSRKRKIFMLCLIVGAAFFYYNPMTSYTTQNFNSVEIDVNVKQS